MPLITGARVGCYEVLSPLGSGGMGEVYRAFDTKLRRQVAVKVLPGTLLPDRERMGRFEREAHLLAALNHPNIAAVYGFEDSGGAPALVMELVEGETLAERIARGRMEIEETVGLARQLAEALEYAHDRGIVHRDLKPANVRIREDGVLKVLDFGIAKALAETSAAQDIHTSPTFSSETTQAGVILGTPAYMSPEQARGKPVDRRTDIWAFGCVVFEMLAGKPAFQGETVTDTLSCILTQEPEWSGLPAATPAGLRNVLRRCLQKDSKKRFQAIGDARIEIEESLAAPGSVAAGSATGKVEASARGEVRVARVALYAAVAALVALAAFAGWWLHERLNPLAVWTGTVVAGSNVAFGPRISPDGHTLAFQAMMGNLTQVAVANIDSGTWTLLTHDVNRGFVNEIAWAPNGSAVYFDRVVGTPKGIYSVPAIGGGERLILEDAGTPESLPDGSLIVAKNDVGARLRICHYWPDSQRLEPLPGWMTLDTTIPLRTFPDGKELVFFGAANSPDAADSLYAMDVATGKTRRLAPELNIQRRGESLPLAPTADGQQVIVDIPSGDLHRLVAIPRDGGRAVTDVVTLTKAPWYLDAARDGTLYADLIDRPHEYLRWAPSGGSPEVLAHSETLRLEQSPYMDPVLLTDGNILIDNRSFGRGQLLVGKPGGDFFPLLETREEIHSLAAALPDDEVAIVLGSGDERMIAIASANEGRLVRRLQGTRGKEINALAASPDGATIYYSSGGVIWAIPASDGSPREIAKGNSMAVDPNGRTLVIKADGASGGRLFRVSTAGGAVEEIPVPREWSLAPVSIGQSAVAKDGKILIPVSPPDSWFYRLAQLDAHGGQGSVVPVSYSGDTIAGGWTSDGRIVAAGLPLKGQIWHFSMVGGASVHGAAASQK